MAGFSSEKFVKKLAELNSSQQSILTLSLWLIHHRKHHAAIVQTWMKELRKATQPKRLTYMYLANDVIQNSRKKEPLYSKEFATVLKGAFETISKDCDDKTWIGLSRILSVWEERSIYDKDQVSEWRKSIGTRANVSKEELRSSKSQRSAGKSKRPDKERDQPNKRKRGESSRPESSRPATPSKSPIAKLPPPPLPCEGVIIDPDTLIKAMKALENSASTDSSIREKLAGLPPEVSDVSLLDKIRDKGTAEKLQRQVDIAAGLLAEYNSRLIRELEERKNMGVMLATYIRNQNDQLSLQEQKLSEYREKLKRVSQVRNELKSHLQNLPDLSLLPSVTGGLAPLPSVNDLFHLGARQESHKYPSSLGSSSASPNSASPDSVSTPTS